MQKPEIRVSGTEVVQKLEIRVSGTETVQKPEQEWRSRMYQKYKKELQKFVQGKSKYTWDELEELFSEAFEDEALTSEEYDGLMAELMEADCVD